MKLSYTICNIITPSTVNKEYSHYGDTSYLFSYDSGSSYLYLESNLNCKHNTYLPVNAFNRYIYSSLINSSNLNPEYKIAVLYNNEENKSSDDPKNVITNSISTLTYNYCSPKLLSYYFNIKVENNKNVEFVGKPIHRFYNLYDASCLTGPLISHNVTNIAYTSNYVTGTNKTMLSYLELAKNYITASKSAYSFYYGTNSKNTIESTRNSTYISYSFSDTAYNTNTITYILKPETVNYSNISADNLMYSHLKYNDKYIDTSKPINIFSSTVKLNSPTKSIIDSYTYICRPENVNYLHVNKLSTDTTESVRGIFSASCFANGEKIIPHQEYVKLTSDPNICDLFFFISDSIVSTHGNVFFRWTADLANLSIKNYNFRNSANYKVEFSFDFTIDWRIKNLTSASNNVDKFNFTNIIELDKTNTTVSFSKDAVKCPVSSTAMSNSIFNISKISDAIKVDVKKLEVINESNKERIYINNVYFWIVGNEQNNTTTNWDNIYNKSNSWRHLRPIDSISLWKLQGVPVNDVYHIDKKNNNIITPVLSDSTTSTCLQIDNDMVYKLFYAASNSEGNVQVVPQSNITRSDTNSKYIKPIQYYDTISYNTSIKDTKLNINYTSANKTKIPNYYPSPVNYFTRWFFSLYDANNTLGTVYSYQNEKNFCTIDRETGFLTICYNTNVNVPIKFKVENVFNPDIYTESVITVSYSYTASVVSTYSGTVTKSNSVTNITGNSYQGTTYMTVNVVSYSGNSYSTSTGQVNKYQNGVVKVVSTNTSSSAYTPKKYYQSSTSYN